MMESSTRISTAAKTVLEAMVHSISRLVMGMDQPTVVKTTKGLTLCSLTPARRDGLARGQHKPGGNTRV